MYSGLAFHFGMTLTVWKFDVFLRKEKNTLETGNCRECDVFYFANHRVFSCRHPDQLRFIPPASPVEVFVCSVWPRGKFPVVMLIQ